MQLVELGFALMFFFSCLLLYTNLRRPKRLEVSPNFCVRCYHKVLLGIRNPWIIKREQNSSSIHPDLTRSIQVDVIIELVSWRVQETSEPAKITRPQSSAQLSTPRPTSETGIRDPEWHRDTPFAMVSLSRDGAIMSTISRVGIAEAPCSSRGCSRGCIGGGN